MSSQLGSLEPVNPLDVCTDSSRHKFQGMPCAGAIVLLDSFIKIIEREVPSGEGNESLSDKSSLWSVLCSLDLVRAES